MRIVGVAALVAGACATIHHKEDFSGEWESRWVQSKHKGDYGKFIVTPGKFFADAEASKGLKTTQDSKFYAISSAMETPVDATAGNGVLVIQFEVKHEQFMDCGGAYLKFFPAGTDQEAMNDKTDYYIMFGPDVCGPQTKRVHIIFNYKGKNLLWKKEERPAEDDVTHLYTLVLNTKELSYELHVDGKKRHFGSLEEDWDFLPPKQIDDPADKKPDDWIDEAEIDDPEDSKPAGWDDIPAQVPDPDATKPEDWDTAEDGEWEPPMIANPDFKGEWKPKRIPNPAYKGVWSPRQIDNPEYAPDPDLVNYKDISVIGVDVWQVRSGTIFDDIIITDSLEEAQAYAEETFHKHIDAEKAAKEKKDAEDRAAAQASSPEEDPELPEDAEEL